MSLQSSKMIALIGKWIYPIVGYQTLLFDSKLNALMCENLESLQNTQQTQKNKKSPRAIICYRELENLRIIYAILVGMSRIFGQIFNQLLFFYVF